VPTAPADERSSVNGAAKAGDLPACSGYGARNGTMGIVLGPAYPAVLRLIS
jgi:hypothetical protein